jgi:hypothetical protein
MVNFTLRRGRIEMLSKEILEEIKRKASIGVYEFNIKSEEVKQMLDIITAYRAMLKRLEWIDTPYVGTPCPVCGNLKRMGHTDDCELAALLRGLEG